LISLYKHKVILITLAISVRQLHTSVTNPPTLQRIRLLTYRPMPHQNGAVALVENNRGWVVYLDLYVGTRMGSQGEPDQSGQDYSSRWMTAFGWGAPQPDATFQRCGYSLCAHRI
jgi:hypothetical protein